MKHILFVLLAAIAFNGAAQNQKDLFKQWENAELTHMNSSGTFKYKMDLRNWDDPYMWSASIISEDDEPGSGSGYYAVPEQQAHPIFLTNGSDWGDDKMKYFLDFVSQGGNYYNSSIIIVNDLLYKITENKDHTWKVEHVYSKEKYKGLKGMVAKEKRVKELAEMDHDQIVNDYINAQKAILESKTPAYKKEHSAYYERFALEKSWANQDIKDGYDVLIQNEERRKQEGENMNYVKLKNNSSESVWVGTSGSSNQGTEIKPGSSSTWNCSQDAYIQTVTKKGMTYHYKSTSVQVYTSGSGCGQTIAIN